MHYPYSVSSVNGTIITATSNVHKHTETRNISHFIRSPKVHLTFLLSKSKTPTLTFKKALLNPQETHKRNIT